LYRLFAAYTFWGLSRVCRQSGDYQGGLTNAKNASKKKLPSSNRWAMFLTSLFSAVLFVVFFGVVMAFKTI